MHIRPAVKRQIPALCTDCGNIFNTQISFSRNPTFFSNGHVFEIIGTGNEVMGFGGTSVCPSCKGLANFRCDLFDFVDDVFKELRNLGKPEIIYLKELLKTYSESQRTKLDFSQMKQVAEQNGVHIFGKVVRDNINEINGLIALVGVVLSFVALVLSMNEEEKKSNTNIENIYVTALKQNTQELPNYSTKDIPKNQPCPCGSNKKFKHCCGRQYKLKKIKQNIKIFCFILQYNYIFEEYILEDSFYNSPV